MVLLVAAAFLAGFIDSQVGGGGVITLPALLAAGLPPHVALGTNKLVATGASSTASLQYVRAGLVDARHALLFVPVALVGTVAGAWLVLRVASAHIEGLVLVVIVAMAAYVLARPRFGSRSVAGRDRGTWLLGTVPVVVAIAFYDGFLGPGTGTFLIFALTGLLGLGFVRAAALGRVLNLASNVGALAVFAATANVQWSVGLPMLLGTVSGGYLGSHATIRGGTRWVRVLFVAMALVLAFKLAWDLRP